MIKALATLGTVDVLVGQGPDDFGAADVMWALKQFGTIGEVFIDHANGTEYDVAVMAIPFDGRWVNDIHFRAKAVIDGRRRPENIDRLGFDMWVQHESAYQMENARVLGFRGETPNGKFLPDFTARNKDQIYLGIGYKKDPGGFGLSKHFGNPRFARFMSAAISHRKSLSFSSSGDKQDMITNGAALMQLTDFEFKFTPMTRFANSFNVIGECGAYFGNDTGMMHVAASMDIPTFGLTPYPDLRVKNPPICSRGKMRLFDAETDPEELATEFIEFVFPDDHRLPL